MVLFMLLIGYWYHVPLSSCLDTIGTINTNMDPTTAVFRSRTLIYAAKLYCTIVVIFGNRIVAIKALTVLFIHAIHSSSLNTYSKINV